MAWLSTSTSSPRSTSPESRPGTSRSTATSASPSGKRRYYASLLELSLTAIVTFDLDAEITSWNAAAERLFGYTQEEATAETSTTWSRPTSGSARRRSASARSPAQASECSSSRSEYARRKPRRRPAARRPDRRRWCAGRRPRPLPRHQRAAAAERYYESLVELSPSAIVTTDSDSNMTSWNPAAELISTTRARRRSAKHRRALAGRAPPEERRGHARAEKLEPSGCA